MQVDFYHLTGAPAERILTRLVERVLGEGGRMLIVCGEEALAKRVDEHLWTYRPESFLPHGRAGQGEDAGQPVLIACACDATNGARNIALADGVWRDPALSFDRVFLLFGDDRIDEARATWRNLGGRDDLERRFWKQDEAGKWERQA